MTTWARLVPALLLPAVVLAGAGACTDDPNPAPTSRTSASAAPPSGSAPHSQQPRTSPGGPSARAGDTDTGPGCGERAVEAGEFNPDCKEYQGHLDPGGRGRGDTAGEAQLEYACEQGYVPKEKC
ncbi:MULTISPECIES: hypothetical protein [Prauserella salsuginis group]|uniref:Lipoprotein n=2 Tax=Prauserella salsuginis group TaxID=2893672 RepID=A0A839XLV7_9PSEU|nr:MULTISPECIES: hypothetical protein [Prauserella salsuginis group]MBB3663731.1 hypothetical protein [Prauserella sediminis]MCR3722489.1 hypothetical protein [Prauserella flava]MCR3736931.1 hypothetical protein [Prauserella salsuginis]